MLRRTQLSWLLLALLLTWLMPQRAAATYVDETYNYQVMLSGSNTIRIQVPCYDQDGADCWIKDGKLKVTWTDDSNVSHTEVCFKWWRPGDTDTDSDSKDIWMGFSTAVDGRFEVTQGNSSNRFTLTKGDGDMSRLVYRNNDGTSYSVTAVWHLPYSLLGKSLNFSWAVQRNGNSRSDEPVSGLNDVPITVPAAENVVTPQVTMATIAYSEAGKLEIPWFIASNKLTKLQYEYKDADGKLVTTDMGTQLSSGTIRLDATEPHNSFRVVASYKDNNDYLIENVSSTAQDLTMIHAPIGLTATPLDDRKASVRLTWNILYPSVDDILSTDFFEIQRSLTGKETDFVTIGSEPFLLDNGGNTVFEYVDSTLTDAIAQGQLKGGGTLDSLTYRVRRMCTQNWGWTNNNCAASASCVVDDIHLLRFSEYSAKWEDERAFTVRVSWNYADEYNAVWDNRAKMMLRVTMKNGAGEVVDTMLYELNANEREQRYKVVELSRPCVNYEIEMYIDRGTSPLCNYEDLTPYYFPIRNAADWYTFRQKVVDAKGEQAVNARLYADISVSDPVGYINDSHWTGIFDGNGHTITADIYGGTKNCFAPFYKAKDYTIRNLHVTGSVSGANHCSGLVGSSDATEGRRNIITNCRVSATITAIRWGKYAGGFIGHGHNADHDITNCLFDGKLICNGTDGKTYGGAFIGWSENDVENRLTNCVEKGTHEGIERTSLCYKHIGNGVGEAYANNSVCKNNFCTTFYTGNNPIDLNDNIEIDGKSFMVIRNTNDWDTFRQKVQNSNGQDVNAILAADLSISISNLDKSVGLDSGPYYGIFDGNGHTLNVNLSASSNYYAALFPTVGNATFRNLYITGDIKGYLHSAGLIGHARNSSVTVNIEKVWISANVTTTDRYVAGFIGHTEGAKIKMFHCRFDGTLKSELTSGDRYGGTFVGWGGGSWEHRYLYENCTSVNISRFGMNYYYNGSYAYALSGEDLCISAHNWGEVASDNSSITDQKTVVSRMNASQPGSWQLLDGKAVPVWDVQPTGKPEDKTADELLAVLGNGWTKNGDAAVPVTRTFTDPNNQYATGKVIGFYHESIGKIDETLMTASRQSSVVLTWTTDGNPIDYFTVLRRVKGSDDEWKPIATNLTLEQYEDTTVSPLVDYEYKVLASNDCEGNKTTETKVAEGACKHSGRVTGYVRMQDGTGVPNISVSIQSGSTVVTAVTDQTGKYVADELPYNGQQSITYDVTPVSSSAIQLETESCTATFDTRTNDLTLNDFIITNGHKFSGYVMYDGTSIPVKGAHFRVGDNPVYNAKGSLVETDFDGSFSFYVLDGKNIIQTYMDGHNFVYDGYFKSKEEGYVFTEDVAKIYFYDSTLVKVTGRVVGGDDQGLLPLDNNLSRNNLGRNLTMVLTLEGDNTSWLVYDNLNPTMSKREVIFPHPGGNGHQTVAEVHRKRMEVKPDSVTGEYVLNLPPVRWKVQQVYCDGYSTLYQDGMVSEVIDLTDCLKADTIKNEGTFTDIDGNVVYQPQEVYNYRYNRIFHAPVEITYRQVGYDSFDYFGDKSYTSRTIADGRVEVPLVGQKVAGYSDYKNPYDIYTHTPTLKEQQASHKGEGSDVYGNLFDGNANTKWCVVSNSNGWWVNFKTDKLVSASSLNLTTGNDTQTYDGRNPKGIRLLGRATETDEWTTLLGTDDAGMEAYNLKTYNYNIADNKFYQFFRLEILTTNWGNIGSYEGYEVQLGELSLTCRGKEDSKPEEDHGPEPLISDKAYYTFGHPVFSVARRYPIEINVVERYKYNNDTRTGKEDLVKIGGGQVTVHNGMKNNQDPIIVDLDDNGCGRFYLDVDATTRLLTGEDALRTVTMTLVQDSVTYEAEPLRGYILNMFATGESKDVLINGKPILVDVLRDPPGGESKATLSKGSKLNYSFSLDMNMKAGVNLTWKMGSEFENFQTVVAAPSGVGSANGVINASNFENVVDNAYTYDFEGHRAYNYTINVNQDISTSSDHKMVGADADLYIGLVQNIVVTPMSTIIAIPDKAFNQMRGRLGSDAATYGSLVEIAEGTDTEGNKYHLVRDESLGYGPTVKSQFVHSQKHILTEIIPQKVKELRALMFTGTAAEADTQANATGKPVYRSLLDPEDENFGLVNMKDGKVFYYTSTMAEEDSMNYVIHLPSGTTTNPSDEVAETCEIIYDWLEMIAQNEHEKLEANDLLANYDVDGGTSVSYGEEFESEYSETNYYHLPGFISQAWFDTSGVDATLAVTSIVGVKIVGAILKKLVWAKYGQLGETIVTGTDKSDDKGPFHTKVSFMGTQNEFSLVPVFEYNTKDLSGESKAFSRKESFEISMDKKSHLNFDVYRVWSDRITDSNNESASPYNVFTNNSFENLQAVVEENIRRGSSMTDIRYPRSFVYRTRGGATATPWEDERKTVVYEPGRVLDERTKKIQNPKISLDRQSISGVALDQPARFKAYLTNESEQPEMATGGLSLFTLYLDQTTNPNGAKILIDGSPIINSGFDVLLEPGKVVQKTIEVYAGDSFDYEGIQLGLCSPDDWETVYEQVAFDVHFMRSAGPVNISSPSDKWVMNTDASWNAERGWYLPVNIDGFNKHQHNFDHIEFQYKESQRGEDYWTNLCSYYADSLLMEKASGVREMIPENGNIVTQFYGEGTVMEKAYDLRAVLYCRDGNSFLTTSSKIISGVKDTRRPQLFGTPEPRTGIIGHGDNIVFNFSEDIEHNYLNATTNFEVKGETNNNNVSETISLQFDSKSNACVETEAQRNFTGKDVTIDVMIKPTETGRDMPIFSHGTNGRKLQLWITADHHLRAVVNDQIFTSTDTIAKGVFTQVAMAMSQDSTLTFFNGGKEIGSFKLTSLYNGTGKLIFGRTNENKRSDSQYYDGRMMEARIWYRALNGGQVGTTYGSKRLTGYEMGLVDYYPMNEGSGKYIIDHTQGANAELKGAAWAMPRGMSLHLDFEDHGMALNANAINRTAEQDYTLMFWFRTDSEGRGVLLSNGRGQKNDIGAENQFNIAFEAEKLMYRSNGMAVEVPGDWSDGQWHHYAMTVNRSHALSNIYVDNTLLATFSADSLGGISGGHPLIGATRYDEMKDSVTTTTDTGNWLRGNIDELCFFAQALPATLIKSYSTKSPKGDEVGLLTYLSFDRQERQKDNNIELVPYPYSKKIYLDENGNPRYELDPITKEPTSTLVRDYPFADEVSVETVLAHIDATSAAPVVPNEELKNLNFSFVGKDNQVLVIVNEQAQRINRRNVYVTLRDIEDKNGNAMSSPATANFYFTTSSLQWFSNRMTETAHVGSNNYIYFLISNDDAVSHTYTIENCPKWLTMTKYSDIVGPEELVSISAAVNNNLNVGVYDEIIYLTDENGVSEPLYLNLTVECDEPEWAEGVSGDLLQYSMNLAGQVYVNNELDIDPHDIVGVFDNENRCHGYAHIDYSALTGETGVYLTIYDSAPSGTELYFKLWQYSTGLEQMLTVDGKQTIKFEKSTILGINTPVRLANNGSYTQTFNLKEGWNWISFNVQSEALFNLNTLLDGLPWLENDVLTDMSSDLTLVYKNGHWLSSENLSTVRLSPRKAYAIKVQKNISFPVGGYIIKAHDMRTIDLHEGWNAIGYTPMMNLTVETALSDYYDKAKAGDVIKSHTEFAYFTITGGVGRWKGSLQYLKPGEGYLMLRKDSTRTSFTYPFYEPGSTFLDEWSYTTVKNTPKRHRNTMSLMAVVEGFDTEEGDRLVAYSAGEQCGEVEISATNEDEKVLYMNINGDIPSAIWFAIERDGEIVASSGEQMKFNANGVVGAPDQPTAINFARTDTTGGYWYSISGIRLPKRPTQKGIYIYNGKRIVIK